MPPKQSVTLTEAELRIMDVLWRKGSATVQQVLEALPAKPSLAYNSVLTTVRILEKKGYVKHVKDGRAHIYEPQIQRNEATRSEIRHLVSRFFGNSHEALVLNILEDEGLERGRAEALAGIAGEERRAVIALNQLALQSLAQAPAASLVNSAIVGIGVALLAWTLLRVAGRQDSGTRFAVWFFALLAIAALPFLGGSASHGMTARTPFTISSSWAVYLVLGWAAISVLCFLRLGVGLWQILRLRRSCKDVELQRLDPQLRSVMEEFESVRRVKLCVSDEVKAPAAVGFFRPAIVVPSWGLTELSVDELKVTLLHELAHLRRWDDWTNLVQKMVKAVFFFHPAVWWIEGRLALEREMACDDLVLEQTANPRAYAASLISFAEKIQRGRELALVHAVVGRVKQISQRVTRILDAKRPSATRVWKPVMGLVTVLSGAALVATPYAPRLVSFQETSPTRVESASIPARSAVAPIATGQAAKPKAIQMHAVMVPVKLKVRSMPKPHVILAKATQREIQSPDMTMVMRSMRYDEQGSQVWTLCIWRVTEGKEGQRHVEAMFVVTKI